ncbi:MAG: dihydroorotate dehydrogenase electron transfer subunit [Clostridia bacterium]|nr:dihydroorotate dehydrogenase electron transfer subunit [Clostridia bacterium]
MENVILTVTENRPITPSGNVYRMKLEGDVSAVSRPGQFVNLKIDGLYLRRPISVCDVEDGLLVLIYKVVGKGTEKMAAAAPGDSFDTLTGLGNGYDLGPAGERPLLLGGGVGVPPLIYLAKELARRGAKPSAVIGFNTAAEVFGEEELSRHCESVTVTTADGTYGAKGFVTDALPQQYTHFYCCGPMPMLKAVYGSTVTDGQLSFEERMGCGFGACMGCTVRTRDGYKRICKDGPVLSKGEILWDN